MGDSLQQGSRVSRGKTFLLQRVRAIQITVLSSLFPQSDPTWRGEWRDGLRPDGWGRSANNKPHEVQVGLSVTRGAVARTSSTSWPGCELQAGRKESAVLIFPAQLSIYAGATPRLTEEPLVSCAGGDLCQARVGRGCAGTPGLCLTWMGWSSGAVILLAGLVIPWAT